MDDESLRPELETEVNQLEAEIKTRELSTLLSGSYDQGNAC